MLIAPALYVGWWCAWTGVRGNLTPLLGATLLALVGFGASSLLLGPETPGHAQVWGICGFFVLFFPFGMPVVRRAFAGLAELPRGAALRPRRAELFRGAFVWPFVAWGALAAATVLWTSSRPLLWLGPALGLFGLVLLRLVLPWVAREPEPLGGPDPEGLARAYAAFRRRRVLTMYWMFVILSLCVTGSWGAFAGLAAGWIGAILGTLIGIWGAAFGTWADAQRYLLRRQLSGAAPPR
jgi:hypothetical protein